MLYLKYLFHDGGMVATEFFSLQLSFMPPLSDFSASSQMNVNACSCLNFQTHETNKCLTATYTHARVRVHTHTHGPIHTT